MVEALCKELILRKNESHQPVETIYFGGGTPSLLTIDELNLLMDTIYQNYTVIENPEITLEANPDDLSKEKIEQLAQSPVNRLSIGIQSFYDEDLKLMNRAHHAEEAIHCLTEASRYFNNITIDLIYGIPNMSLERWVKNIEKALSFGIPHISAYALTVEPKTALQKLIEKGHIPAVDEALAEQHFIALTALLEKNNFIHYELSNFGKEGFFSRNNTAYWTGKPYIGVGPSAHSFNGNSRSWNIANNSLYLKAIENGKLPSEKETLSTTDQYNEYIMTGLRTMHGISLEKIVTNFGENYKNQLLIQADKHLKNGFLILENERIFISKKGKFLSDGLSSDLFLLNL